MNKTIKQTLFAAVALLSAGVTLEAAQINGSITFRGGEELNTGSVNTATRVTGWLDGTGASPKVVSRSGDFATFVSVGATATFSAPWTFGSGRSALWSVGGFTFDLTTSTIVHQGNGTLNVSGTGTISGNGFDPTPGSWTFSTQNPPANGVFSFSGATAAMPSSPTPTATSTPTSTPSATATATETPTSTPTATATATETPTSTPTSTATATATSTATATATATSTATATATSTATATASATSTSTATPSATRSPTPTPTPTLTPCALAACSPPYPTAIPGCARCNIPFNESEVLRAFRMSVDAECNPTTLQMFYNDEHAMTLGIRRIVVTTCAGSTATDYPISAGPTATPTCVTGPLIGATEDQGGTDTADRPMFPAMFITDVTANPGNELAGDWQFGGRAIKPDAVFGTWKGAVKTIDKTNDTVTVTPDADPPKNNWNLDGATCGGADPVPTPTPTDQGYGAECRWDLTNPSLGLIPGHEYRLYFMVHDGDQNKTGGDVGQDCVYFVMPGTAPTPTATPSPTPSASPSPTSTPTPTPGIVSVGDPTFNGKTVTIIFFNETGSNQVLVPNLSVTWNQTHNGNLQNIKFNGTTIWNTSTGNGMLTATSLLGTTAQRTIAPGACGTMIITFQSNADTVAADYTGTANFSPFGSVVFLP